MVESPETQDELRGRIKRALELAVKYGGIDESHHQTWVIDQMVRELTGCPTISQELGESEEYLKLVREAREGEDGPETYDWDLGIAP